MRRPVQLLLCFSGRVASRISFLVAILQQAVPGPCWLGAGDARTIVLFFFIPQTAVFFGRPVFSVSTAGYAKSVFLKSVRAALFQAPTRPPSKSIVDLPPACESK